MPGGDTLQEIAAFVIVTSAVVYLSSRLTGWPRLGRRNRDSAGPEAPVRLGARLARGLRNENRSPFKIASFRVCGRRKRR